MATGYTMCHGQCQQCGCCYNTVAVATTQWLLLQHTGCRYNTLAASRRKWLPLQHSDCRYNTVVWCQPMWLQLQPATVWRHPGWGSSQTFHTKFNAVVNSTNRRGRLGKRPVFQVPWSYISIEGDPVFSLLPPHGTRLPLTIPCQMLIYANRSFFGFCWIYNKTKRWFSF